MIRYSLPDELTAALKSYDVKAFRQVWAQTKLINEIEASQVFLYDLIESNFRFSKQTQMLAMIEEVLKSGLNLNFDFDHIAQTPLCLAIFVGSNKLVEMMLKYGARVNYVIDDLKFDDEPGLYGDKYTALNCFYNVQSDLFMLFTVDLNTDYNQYDEDRINDRDSKVLVSKHHYQKLQLFGRQAKEFYEMEGTLKQAGAKTFEELRL
jgi:hypothetical protein